MGKVRDIIQILIIAAIIFMSMIMALIYGEEIRLLLRAYPGLFFFLWTTFTLIFCFWRLTETYPEWRLWERLRALGRKLKRW